MQRPRRGRGKTLLARTFPTMLPRLAIEEARETTNIYSVAGMLPLGTPLINQGPFRATPHHKPRGAGGRRTLAATR